MAASNIFSTTNNYTNYYSGDLQNALQKALTPIQYPQVIIDNPKFKEGDKVICVKGKIPNTIHRSEVEGRGVGWVEGNIFTVNNWTIISGGRVYWFKDAPNGVYEDQLALYDYGVDEVYKKLRAKAKRAISRMEKRGA